MILQLHPAIPVETPKGKGWALGWIDYSTETDLYWIVGQDSKEIWIWANKDVRLQNNFTVGRGTPKENGNN